MRIIMVIAIALVPSLALAKDNLDAARHEMIVSDYRDAEKLLKRSINDFYGDPYAHFELGSTMRAQGRYTAALLEFGEVLQQTEDPKLTCDALYGIALTRDLMGEALPAAAAWNQYLRFASRIDDEAPIRIARDHRDYAEYVAGVGRSVGRR
jgi:tetratricopeptide (TPR) repeat protein